MKSLKKRKFLDMDGLWSNNWPFGRYLPKTATWITDAKVTFLVDDQIDTNRYIFDSETH